MTNPFQSRKFTDEEMLECLSQGMTLAEIARKFGVNQSSTTRRKNKLVQEGLLSLDNTPYALPEGHYLKGVTYKTNANGILEPYWVKSKATLEGDQQEALDEMLEAFKAKLPRYNPIIRKSQIVKEDSLVVFPLGDPHIGMMAWDEECGENWDLKIAEEVFCRIFAEVMHDAPPCDHCLIVNLADLLHYDNIDGITSRSKNVLDRDGRTLKMFRVALLIVRFMIERSLEKHEHVTFMNLNGNHDDVLSMAIGEAIKVAYENNPRVSIITGYKPIQYFQWGKTMIAAHHGHTIKMEKLPSVIACDEPKMWGDTQFRYCLTGHIHCDSVVPLPGMQVESFSTLAAKDSFAAWHGYRSTRNQKAIIYTKEGGEKKRYITSLP